MPEINKPGDEISKRPGTLELLLDLELRRLRSGGKAQMPLQQIIKWTTGSIVELETAVNEPVEVVVNNCVIARGEVVVVDGNYGVRVQQIVSRGERLQTTGGPSEEAQ